jgi:hypothetical protein
MSDKVKTLILGFFLCMGSMTLETRSQEAVNPVGPGHKHKPKPLPCTEGKVVTPPAWYQKLATVSRFVLVLDEDAVLDCETGLVWERSPSIGGLSWKAAMLRCMELTKGKRMGWRLPTAWELLTLMDSTKFRPTFFDPPLPSGHPFVNVRSTSYWTATTDFLKRNPEIAIGLDLLKVFGVFVQDYSKSKEFLAWCVRAPGGYDGHTF